MFVHPKTGSMGADNINDESKAYLYKKILNCIESNDLYKIEIEATNNALIFNKLKLRNG